MTDITLLFNAIKQAFAAPSIFSTKIFIYIYIYVYIYIYIDIYAIINMFTILPWRAVYNNTGLPSNLGYGLDQIFVMQKSLTQIFRTRTMMMNISAIFYYLSIARKRVPNML